MPRVFGGEDRFMDTKRNKQNVLRLCFIASALLLCLIPLVCMTFARTDETTENRRLSKFPSLTTDGGLNKDFLSQTGKYYEDHFAFRNQVVGADGVLQALFGVSSADTVIKGTGGWLYYSATLPDFQRSHVMTDRAAYNAVHNITLMRDFVESRGASFLLTVAPNKNSLYPEHMPYYSPQGTGEKNIDKLLPLLKEAEIPYADLFAAFKNEDEILYLMRDSHWNGRGALLAYNTIADAAGMAHETFSGAQTVRAKDEVGDLGRMAYAVFAKPEWNERLDFEPGYRFTSAGSDVEDGFLTTENPNGTGRLLMYRDSFGNTLLPLFAESCSAACFSKATPYLLEKHLAEQTPELVIAEKVERNLADFAGDPPVMTAPSIPAEAAESAQDAKAELTAKVAAADFSFVQIAGSVETQTEHSAVFVGLGGTLYEAFLISGKDGDDGYMLYLPADRVRDGDSVTVYYRAGGRLFEVTTIPITIQEAF